MVVVHRVHRARAALAGCTTTSAGRSLEAFKGAPAEAYQDGWSIKPHGAICCRPANRIGHVGGFKDRRWCRIQCSCLRLLWRVDRRVRRRALMERDVPPVSFGLSARVFLYPVKGLADGREANRDAIRQRVESYMKCVVGLGFTPADVFSSYERLLPVSLVHADVRSPVQRRGDPSAGRRGDLQSDDRGLRQAVPIASSMAGDRIRPDADAVGGPA